MSIYTTLYPTQDPIAYTSVAPGVEYVDSNIVTTLGPIYAPKIYARELTGLEIASSGKIAVTLLDEHAFDITDNTQNVILFTARDGNSFKLETEGGNAYLQLGPDSNVSIQAGSNVNVSAGNEMNLAATAGASIASGSNIDISASNAVTVASTSTEIAASQEIKMSSQLVDVDAAGAFDLSAGSNVIRSSGTTTMSSGGTMSIAASNDFDLSVRNGDIGMVAHDGGVLLQSVTDTVSVQAGSNVVVGAPAFAVTTSNFDVDASTLNMSASNATLTAASNMTFESGSTLAIASTGSNVTIDAHTSLTTVSQTTYMSSTQGFKVSADGTLDLLSASNLNVSSSNDIDVNGLKAVAVTAVDALLLASTASNVVVTAAGSITLSSSNLITIDGPINLTQGITGLSELSSDCNISISASNDIVNRSENFIVAASGDISAAASNGVDIKALAGPINISSRDDDAELESGCNIYITASNNVFITGTLENVKVSASNGVFDVDARSATIDAATTLNVTTGQTSTFTATTSNIVFNAAAGTVDVNASYIDMDADVVDITASNGPVRVDALDDVQLHARSADLKFTAGRHAIMTAVQKIDVTAGTGALTMKSTSSNVDISAGKDIELESGSNIYVTASNNVFITATLENVEIKATDDVVMDAKKNTSITSSSNLTVAANYIRTTSTGRTDAFVDTYFLNSANSSWLEASNLQLRAKTGLVKVMGSSVASGGKVVTAQMEAVGNSNILELKASESGKQQFMIGNHEVISMYKTANYDPADSNSLTGYKVKVNADFEIMGTVNSIGLTQTELQVEDKTIQLAYNIDATTPDGIANDGAGLIVAGLPATGAVSATNPERYEKSIRWRQGPGDGVLGMGGAAANNESFWDVKGGAMRFTHVDEATGDETSFILRINSTGEFEMVKRNKKFAGGQETFVKCAKFGRVLI